MNSAHHKKACTVGWQPDGKDDEVGVKEWGEERGVNHCTPACVVEVVRRPPKEHTNIHVSLIRVTEDAKWSKNVNVSRRIIVLSMLVHLRLFCRYTCACSLGLFSHLLHIHR
jgi:hypothetical protein